ncbi:E3 ubiquitin-protein ligase UBR2-like, partial [Sinocyclocheilus grahami]|uniref:E3 ubiquitin-protein ligase UBR2-like n=1 Tax=Sinocyclocheilus grahami TaxID=75366 RepID=UPI0007AC6290
KWLQVSNLPKEVYQHLACYVPKIYCLGPNLNPQNEDLLAPLLLQSPLEWYLCGEEPSVGLAKLEQNNQPSQLCGHVFKDPLANLSDEMIARTYNVFSIILKYAVDMLTWEKEDELPEGLEPPERGDTYYCMLFNDEVHTYEQVIYTLQKAVNCTQKEAVSFATTVDRDVSSPAVSSTVISASDVTPTDRWLNV